MRPVMMVISFCCGHIIMNLQVLDVGLHMESLQHLLLSLCHMVVDMFVYLNNLVMEPGSPPERPEEFSVYLFIYFL